MTARVSIGVAGTLGPETVARLAPAVEAAGFATLWVNDTPDGDALAALSAAADVTDRLTLATGVIPVDRRSPDTIAREVLTAGLPQERLVLGIGSGASRTGALARAGEAADALRSELDARVVVGALGPKMRRLAAERADGVLLNWVPAAAAAAQAAALHAHSPGTRVIVYVRAAIDSAASDRLADETARYASYPNYAANLARLGVDAVETTFRDEDELRERLPVYREGVDEVVLRAITGDDRIETLLDFVARTAPEPHGVGA